jgi:dGTPase
MMDSKVTWEKLLNSTRRKPKEAKAIFSNNLNTTDENAGKSQEHRTEIERDYDRILFSTPVRRLADKTQVFPLDKNDSVRTRLTHSHEVSNLARSIGTALVFQPENGIGKSVTNSNRNIPALLAAVGLVHDLGNPPFGHQGEHAIQSWFFTNIIVLCDLKTEQQKQDFLRFEGNAQAFRLVTRLQLINDAYGLDLTYATLAAMMKYPTASNEIVDDHVAKKKHGFFASEKHIVEDVHRATGLAFGKRHALTYVMEACDDIAYVVLDAEDAVKKGLASFSDLMAFLKAKSNGDPLINKVVQQSENKHNIHQNIPNLSPLELNDVSMQRFRVYAIGEMVNAVSKAFNKNQDNLLQGNLSNPLIKESDAKELCAKLKEFSKLHAYSHSSVLGLELQGFNVIQGLMDMIWAAIIDRAISTELSSTRKHPFTKYVYQRISENYRRIFENPTEEDKTLPTRYRECLLLTDMISGMTDSFALDLFNDLSRKKGNFETGLYLNK